MTLLKTLIQPDHDENQERAEVADAANLLQVGEFQLLVDPESGTYEANNKLWTGAGQDTLARKHRP